jgi:hypothetical protein
VPSADPSVSPSTPPALPSLSPSPEPSIFIGDLPDADGSLTAIDIHAGTIIVAGQSDGAPVVLRSKDGRWSPATTPRVDGQLSGLARLDDGRVIAIGFDLDVDGSTGYIWVSQDDGVTWSPVLEIDGGAAYDVIVGGGTIVVAGDAGNPETANPKAAIWTSSDAATWRRARLDLADSASLRASTAWSGGFAAVGARLPGTTRDSAPLWLASTPSDWAATVSDLSPKLATTQVWSIGDRLAVGGGTNRPGEQYPFVATSADGRDWTHYQLSDAEGYVSAMTDARGTLVAAGVSADRLLVWPDSVAATGTIELEASGASVADISWDAALGLVAVGSRDGRIALWQVEADSS